MTEWKEYKLGEIAEIITGYPFPGDKYESTGNLRVVRGENVTIGNLRWDTEKHWNHETEGLEKYFLQSGDIVIGMDGSRVGDNRAKVKQVDLPLILAQRVACLRAKKEFSQGYLWYTIFSDNFKKYVEAIHTGTSIPHISQKQIEDFEILCPPLETQRRISAILSSLDDKIDLLHRENATLEAMAETLFRQWFVEEAKEDWEEGKLGDWVVIKRGGSPRPINDYLSPTGYRWLKISDVTNLNSPYIFQTKEYIKESGLSKTVYLKEGSLVLSNSATPGIPKILCVDSCIHDGWLYFPKSTFSKIYLYLLFKYIRKDLVNLGNGSIFTNLKTDILKEYKVVKPDAKTLEIFDQQVQPIFDKLYSNETQIQTLTQTRDELLSRLMNNELKI